MAEQEYNFTHIDKLTLDRELERQADLMQQYGRKLADAERIRDEEKAAYEVQQAETLLAVCRNPDAYGITKVSEATNKAAVTLDKDVQDKRKELIDAEHSVGVYKAAVKAVDHRMRSLEKLVVLFNMDYFSTPRTLHAEVNQERRRLARDFEKEEVRTRARRRRVEAEEDDDED